MKLVTYFSYIVLLGFSLLATGSLTPAHGKTQQILVLGDSISAAYNMPVEQGWVYLLGQQLTTNYQVTNASISGQTSGNGLQQIDNLIKQHQPNIVILELGGNDGLRGQSLIRMEQNLGSIIEHSLENGAKVLLLGMKIPPNYGKRYTNAFEGVYHKLASTYSVQLIPFLLQDIATDTKFMQADGIHPNPDAQPLIAKRVAEALEKYQSTPEELAPAPEPTSVPD